LALSLRVNLLALENASAVSAFICETDVNVKNIFKNEVSA
jgi:hypothetical protein